METQKQNKIDWSRLLKKAAEEGIKKAVELTALGIALGLAFKVVIATVPAVTLSSIIAKVIKVKFLDYMSAGVVK